MTVSTTLESAWTRGALTRTLTSDCSAEAFERPACRDYRNCTLCSWMRRETCVLERDGRWRNWVACRGRYHCPVRTPTSKSKSKNKKPRAAQVPAPTTMTDTIHRARLGTLSLPYCSHFHHHQPRRSTSNCKDAGRDKRIRLWGAQRRSRWRGGGETMTQ
ncbi:hypothetical protein EDB86DRAFT_611509 [Lactarius hatsudake]|nr:hypothetical protein EDB86DRAFT_611509 [Lactarius hatsudake]